MKPFVAFGLVAVLGGACTAEVVVSEEEGALKPRAPLLIQPGEDQILLAVTDDNHAVYQEGQALFATELVAGAPRRELGTVPGTNIAQVLQVGEVVFLWTDPQRSVPGFGVSPLVMWTAEGGAQLISAQSSVGLVATAASADGRQIVFTTNVTADNARGDLVHAFTDDPLRTTTLVASTTMAFPNGAVSSARQLRPRSRARGAGRAVLRRDGHDRDDVEVGRRRAHGSDREHRDAAAVHPRE